VLQCVAVWVAHIGMRACVCICTYDRGQYCVAVCCSVLQWVRVCTYDRGLYLRGGNWKCVLRCVAVCCSVLQCAAVCCRVLQCVAVCCSVLQCVAVWLIKDSILEKGTTLCRCRFDAF